MNTHNPFRAGLAALSVVLAAPAAHATQYHFFQGGFDEGASISGYFELNDTPPLGSIEAGDPAIFPGLDMSEVTAFHVAFSGNSLVEAFTQTLTDLSFLNYDRGSTYLGDGTAEGIATNVLGTATRFDYYTGMAFGGLGGAVTDHDIGNISYSYDPVTVPLPATPWLLMVGLAALIRRRAAG